MRFYTLAHNAEAKPRPADVVDLPRPKGGLEDVGLVFRADADAAIADL